MPHFEELFAQFNGGDSGSAVAWGDITGTLADQTDLQAALDAKLDDSQAAAFGLTLLATATASDARTALALVPGTDVQPYDADLTALAGLATAADKLPYFTGAAAAALTSFTAFARTLLDDVDASSMRTTLGLVIGTDVQAQDAELQAIAGLTSAADRLPYFTGSGTAALATFTSGGRALVNSAGTADTFPYFSALNTVTLGSITAAGRALIDDATASDQRTTLGLVIGTNVQAWDAELQALAGLTSAADQLPYFTGSGTAALTTLTAFARTLLDDTTAANAATTLGLGTGDSPTFAGLTVTGHVNAQTTMVIGNTAAIPANTRVLIDRLGAGTLPTLPGGTALTLQGNNTSTNNNYLVNIAGATGQAGIRFGDSAAANQGRLDYDNATDSFGLYTNAALALTITSAQAANFSGAVTASSAALNTTTLRSFTSAGAAATPVLQVNGTSVATSSLAAGLWATANTAPTLFLGYSANAAVGSHTVVANTNILGVVSFNGSDGSAFREAARIEGFVNGTPGASDMPGGLRFLVTPDGSATAAAALTINQDKTADFASSITAVGGTSSARWLVSYASAVLGIATAADAQACGTFLYSAGSSSANRRWGIVKNATAETGGSAGSDFEIWNYNDSGTLIGTALSIGRVDALVTLAGLLTGANIYNTYTPTLTGITNVSASSANVSGWIRIGNAVLVFAQISVTATASGANTVIDLSVPVASNFGATTQCVGVGSLVTAATEIAPVGITANAANDRARATFVSTSTNARTYALVFGYIVI